MGTPFLFFGIKPPPAALEVIDALRAAPGLNRRYPCDRLHITVCPLGYRHLLDSGAEARARTAAGALVHPPFRVIFDRIDHGMLMSSEPIRGLLAFERVLTATLGHDRHATRAAPFRPHVTLVYGGAPGRYDIDGISWVVEAFSLIESLVGDGAHREIERWGLRG